MVNFDHALFCTHPVLVLIIFELTVLTMVASAPCVASSTGACHAPLLHCTTIHDVGCSKHRCMLPSTPGICRSRSIQTPCSTPTKLHPQKSTVPFWQCRPPMPMPLHAAAAAASTTTVPPNEATVPDVASHIYDIPRAEWLKLQVCLGAGVSMCTPPCMAPALCIHICIHFQCNLSL